MDLREAIPGYREALERETMVREGAFLDITETVGPFELRPLTLLDLVVLRRMHSPLLIEAPAEPREIVRFLWLLSPLYLPGWSFKAWLKRSLFRWHCRRIFKDSVFSAEIELACRAYLDEAHQDAQPSDLRGWDAPHYSDAVYLITLFARHYHWAPAITLNLRLKVVFQLMNEIRERNGQSVGNPSDTLRASWLLRSRKN